MPNRPDASPPGPNASPGPPQPPPRLPPPPPRPPPPRPPQPSPNRPARCARPTARPATNRPSARSPPKPSAHSPAPTRTGASSSAPPLSRPDRLKGRIAIRRCGPLLCVGQAFDGFMPMPPRNPANPKLSRDLVEHRSPARPPQSSNQGHLVPTLPPQRVLMHARGGPKFSFARHTKKPGPRSTREPGWPSVLASLRQPSAPPRGRAAHSRPSAGSGAGSPPVRPSPWPRACRSGGCAPA